MNGFWHYVMPNTIHFFIFFPVKLFNCICENVARYKLYCSFPSKGRVQKKIVILWSLTITGGGGQPEPYPYCKTALFFKTLYTSSIILLFVVVPK